MKTARHYTVIEHPAGFNPWDNNPVLIRLFAEAVRASVTRQALRKTQAQSTVHPTVGQ